MKWVPPEFHDIVWVSPEARAHWEPIIRRLSQWWVEFERLTVLYDRTYALQLLTPEQLLEVMRWALEVDVRVVPLEYTGGRYRVLFCAPEATPTAFIDAWRRNDTQHIGNLLGYPDCCSQWFKGVWDGKGLRDDVAERFRPPQINDACNVLLRDVGVRRIFHLPCSWGCQKTAELAQLYIEYPEVKEISEILSWPMLYTTLHGIAEITTPVFKIRRNSDYYGQIQRREWPGSTYPIHGASGLSFPFGTVHQVKLYRRNSLHEDNGFRSREGMDNAHRFILDQVAANVERNRATTLIDLGCGNGQLLRRIHEEFPNIEPHGVDLSAEKIERARNLLPGAVLQVGDVTRMAFDKVYDIALVSVNRIEEAKRSGNEHFEETLRRHAKLIVRYSYEEMYVEVEKQCKECGESNRISNSCHHADGPSSPAEETSAGHRRNDSSRNADANYAESGADGGDAERSVSNRQDEAGKDRHGG